MARNSQTQTGKIDATYDYTDEKGNHLYQTVKYDPKDFKYRRKKISGGWDWSLGKVRRVLYRLPELFAAPVSALVFDVEGEKDVENLRKHGQIATCNPFGAGSWKSEYNESFRGRPVAIPQDNDEDGRKHSHHVAGELHGIAASVKVVELPGLPPKGDVSDWFDAGHTIEELLEIVENTPEWTPEDVDLAYRPFPTEVLPEPVRSFIKAGAKALGCDEALIALPLLGALAAAIGNTRRIMLKSTWHEPCIFWLTVVCDSGTLKSPAFDLAIGSLRAIESEAVREYRDKLKDYETQKTIYDADLQRWKTQRRTNPNLPPPTTPNEPVCERYVVEDTTIEALANILKNQPRGVLAAWDELAGWVGSFDQYRGGKGGDVSRWLSLHRGGTLTKDRVGNQEMLHVERASVSITGGIQPGALKAALARGRDNFDNGLIARILFAKPPRRPTKWTDDVIPAQVENDVEALFRALVELDFSDTDDQHTPVFLRLTVKAKTIWVRFYNQHNQEIVELPHDQAAAWKKLEGYAARFALLIHVIRTAAGDDTVVDKNSVDEVSITAGITLARWFSHEADRVYAALGGATDSTEGRERREVRRIWQEKFDGRMTVRDLMQSRSLYRNSAEKAEKVLLQFVSAHEANTVIDVTGSEGGRQKVVFVLHDGSNGNTTSGNAGNSEVLLPLPDGEVPPSPPFHDQDGGLLI